MPSPEPDSEWALGLDSSGSREELKPRVAAVLVCCLTRPERGSYCQHGVSVSARYQTLRCASGADDFRLGGIPSP
jgi:hypothetical protein